MSDTNCFLRYLWEAGKGLATSRKQYQPSPPLDGNAYGLVSPILYVGLPPMDRKSLMSRRRLTLRPRSYCFWECKSLTARDLSGLGVGLRIL